ncbi:MAG: sugar phosphate isomerase/epimerase, partial [Angelakisella sp.]
MKLAFSTLGCPDWTWDEIFATAKDMRIDGIEVRGIERVLYAPENPLFSMEKCDATKERLASAGLVISAFTSGAVLGLPDSPTLAVKEIRDYIQLASRMGVPYIRVLSSPSAQPERTDLVQAKELYLMLCAEAKEQGVCLLMETSGALSDSALMAQFMEGTDPASAGVLWDLHHPYRFCGEAPELTYSRIGQYVRYMHVKDSVMKEGQVVYRMMGHGDVPIFDA